MGLRNFDRGRRQSCGSNAFNTQAGFQSNFWPSSKQNNNITGGVQGANGNRSGKSSLFATPQSIKPRDTNYPPIHSPH
jgi:hypothetical protein